MVRVAALLPAVQSGPAATQVQQALVAPRDWPGAGCSHQLRPLERAPGRGAGSWL